MTMTMRGKACQRVRHILAISREDDDIHINLCVIVRREQRAEGAVHETAREDLLITRLAFTLRETSRETAVSRILLAILYLERHKICSRYCIFRCTNSGEEHGVTHTEHHRSIRLLCQLSCLDADFSSIRQRDLLCNYVHLVC